MPEPNAPTISILVSDLSEQGAGRWGGAVRPFLLRQALQHLGHRVEILGFSPQPNPSLVSTPDQPLHQFPLAPYPQLLRSARHLLQQLSGDVIYAYKPKPTSFGLGLWARRWLPPRIPGQGRRPLILDIDDWEMSWFGGEQWRYEAGPKQRLRDLLKPQGAFRTADHPVYLQALERQIPRADAITLHSQFLQQRFGGLWVPNGKDINHFDPQPYDAEASRRRYGLAGYRVLMFPGAPRPYKGIEDVLAALDLLDQPDLRLVIVGGSPYDDYDRQLQNRWGRWLIALPKTPYDQMPQVISAAHVIVVPQRNTPAALAQFPLKLTDGMAMAKPILATWVGDIPKILGDTGYLVDPEAPQQLADQITALFDQWPEAVARGLLARDRCRRLYSIESMAQALGTGLGQWLRPAGQ
ncbi:glycosyltransferase family 4 protein [Prochlorothrix hollandica]|uniref:glycosyltransferase family 4 protein n=1 Tax=Prochlorothrix hollandica TaxID=1223 RepID=UPI00333F4DE9